MALTTFAYYRSKHAESGDNFTEGVQLALYTVDPALAPSDTAAERKALVAAAVSTLLGSEFKSADFETELQLGAAAGTGMATDADVLVVTDYGVRSAIT